MNNNIENTNNKNFIYKNGSISLIESEGKYTIIYETHKTYHSCVEGCKGKCRCKDKDWSQGVWNGHLLSVNTKDFKYINNIYEFLKDNFIELYNYDRNYLEGWIFSNKINFLKIYYKESFLFLEVLVNFFKEFGLFTIDFFNEFKDYYFEKYKKYLNMKINKTFLYDSERFGIAKESRNIKLNNSIFYEDVLPERDIYKFDEEYSNPYDNDTDLDEKLIENYSNLEDNDKEKEVDNIEKLSDTSISFNLIESIINNIDLLNSPNLFNLNLDEKNNDIFDYLEIYKTYKSFSTFNDFMKLKKDIDFLSFFKSNGFSEELFLKLNVKNTEYELDKVNYLWFYMIEDFNNY